MGYRRALLFRWSRRDRLAVLVVALSVAFLVGTTLVVLAAGAQTAAIAAEFGSTGHVTGYESVTAARAAAGTDALVLPYSAVSDSAGDRTVVLGRPPPSVFATELGLDGTGVSLGTIDGAREPTLSGPSGSATVTVQPRPGGSALPPSWYLAPPETVTRLGPSGALVVSPSPASGASGAPLRAALAFFLRGTRQALAALTVAGLGAAVLVGVTVFGVTRMGVRDRSAAIRIARSTGARPRDVLALFAARAGLLAAVGSALGYALGVILPNAAVSVAIASGGAVSLPLAVTEPAVRALVPVVLVPVAIGAAAGALAASPAATRPPARVTDAQAPRRAAAGPDGTRVPDRLGPQLLETRLVVPTAATLAAFVVLATVAAGLGTALAPIAAADTSTVVAPDAPHPLASQVPDAYADALIEGGVEASGEVLLLEVVDGQPFVAVGASFDRYAAVHGATLVTGRLPSGPDEALIGSSLARALAVGAGDRLVLGGSTRERFAVVTVVGRFEAPGATASQLVVSLPTARHLSGVPRGAVHLVSAERLPEPGGADGSAIGVIDVAVPTRAAANSTVSVKVTLRNEGLEPGSRRFTVRYAGGTARRSVDVAPVATETVTVDLPAGRPGQKTVRVGGIERTLRVVEPDAITIDGLPASAPPDGRPLVRVVTLAGEPVANATVAVGDRRWRTDDAGRTRIAFNGTGERRVVATAGDRTATRSVEVRADAGRELAVSVTVTPSNPSVLVGPTARVRLENPWSVPIERTLGLESGATTHRDRVAVGPGETRTLTVPLDRRAPGRYDVVLTFDGRTVAETSYTVTGDDRLAAALASSGRAGQTGLSRAIEAALGNLRLVVAVVVGLAALMTVGATTATFASGVQARRRTLGVHRATGAAPGRVRRLVLADALKLGAASTAIGLVVGLAVVYAAGRLGLLTVLGVGIPPVPPAPVVLAVALAAVGLTLLGAWIATRGALRESPGSLLVGEPIGTEPGGAADD